MRLVAMDLERSNTRSICVSSQYYLDVSFGWIVLHVYNLQWCLLDNNCCIVTISDPIDEDDDTERIAEINRMLSIKNSGVDKYGDLKYEKLTWPRTVDLDLTRSAWKYVSSAYEVAETKPDFSKMLLTHPRYLEVSEKLKKFYSVSEESWTWCYTDDCN